MLKLDSRIDTEISNLRAVIENVRTESTKYIAGITLVFKDH